MTVAAMTVAVVTVGILVIAWCTAMTVAVHTDTPKHIIKSQSPVGMDNSVT